MGSSTGSMFYAFGAFLIIYLVGVSIYQLVLWIKKWRERRKDGNKMVDAIIVLIVIVLLIFALKGTLKHFKGESPCCGGGSGLIKTEIEEKVLEHPAIGKKTVMVSGMHCDHCVKSVTEAIDKIEGASAKVNLKKEEAVVSYDREINDDDLKKAVEEAGFKVVDIRA